MIRWARADARGFIAVANTHCLIQLIHARVRKTRIPDVCLRSVDGVLSDKIQKTRLRLTSGETHT
eukprot:8090561-Lingulodinium_polyedra.AAC.1